MKNLKYFFTLIFLLYGVSPCYALVPPANVDPGIIDSSNINRFELLKNNKPSTNNNTQIEIKTPPEEVSAVNKSVTFTLNNVKFTNNTIFSETILKKFFSDSIGKKVTFEDLRNICNKITSFYREKGYLTSFAYIPPQTVESGIIEIRIFEGKIGNIDISGNKWTKTSYIRNKILQKNNIETKNIFNINNLKKSTDEINQSPYLKSKIIILQGKASESTDIKMNVKELLPIGLSVDWDNSGRDLIGTQKAGITTTVYNLTGFGDNIFANTGFGSRNLGLNTGYTIPVWNKGTVLKLGYSLSKVNLGRIYREGNMRGTSYNFDISLLQPIYKSDKISINSYLSWDMRHSITTLDGMTYKNYELRVIRTGLNASLLDKYGKWSSGFVVSTGLPVWGAKASHVYGEGSSKFVKFNTSLARLQYLPYETLGIFRLSSQFANRPLQTAEQYELGGSQSVRGFEEGLLLGDNGYNASFELRHKIPFLPEKISVPITKKQKLALPLKNKIQFAGFYDQGYAIPIQHGDSGHFTNFLQSVGFGFRVNIIKFINASVDFGIPLGQKRYSEQKHMFCHFYLSTDVF